jgi:phospholipid/cholesterol/gamma-HCH transport system substrate-binding protein
LKITREIKVGLLTVAALLLFIFGYQYLRGKNILERDRIFYAVYNNVEGLSKSAPVTINGLKVGNIDDIRFMDEDGRILVKFHVSDDFEFSKDSQAQVYSTGLIGGKALAVIPNYSSELGLAQSGDTLNGGMKQGLPQEVMDEFLPLKDKIASAVVDIDSFVVDLNSVISPELGGQLSRTMGSLERTSSEIELAVTDVQGILKDNRDNLKATIANLNATSENFRQLSDSLAKVDIAQIVQRLENTIATVEELMASIERGEGSLGKLLKDDQLYINLENTTKQAEELLRDIKLHPKRYVHFSVFGKKEKDYEPPVKQ